MDIEGLYEFKLVHVVNYRCVLCNKKYATETNVIKHLQKNHEIETPSQAQYVSFVGSKRTKVQVNPNTSQMMQPSSTSKVTPNRFPGSKQTQPELAFKCTMCDKLFKSHCGISSHLITSHDVPSGIVSAGYYSVIQIPKTATSSIPTFIPPTKKATEMIPLFSSKNETSESIAPIESEQSPPKCRQQSPVLVTTVSTEPGPALSDAALSTQPSVSLSSDKGQQAKSKKKQREKKNANKKSVGFCKNISNMFSKGLLPVKKLWSKSKPEPQIMPASNNEKEAPPNQNVKVLNLLNQTAQDQNHQNQITQAQDPQIQNTQAQNFHNHISQNPGQQNHDTQTYNPPIENYTQSQISQIQTQTQDLPKVSTPSHGKDDSGPDSTNSPSLVPRTKASRRRRSCNNKDCGPCSIWTDCMECRYCVNKLLKQRCLLRQCNRLNHRLKNREVETLENDQNESNEVAEKEEGLKSDNDSFPGDVSDGISIYESISPNENENITENNGKGFIEEIVGDIFLSTWKEIIKVIPTNNEKMKVYPCKNCGKMFAQFLSASKHCTVKKPKLTTAECPICSKKILVKKNLKRHIKNVHNNPKRKEKLQQEVCVPMCNECDIRFSSKYRLTAHNRRKHGADIPEGHLLRCTECDFSNISESKLKAHFTLVHSDAEQLECKFCPVRFRSKGGLYKHLRTVHKSDGIVPNKVLPDQPVLAKKSHPGILEDPPEFGVVRQNSIVPANVGQNLWNRTIVAKKSLPPSILCVSGQNSLPQSFSGQNFLLPNFSAQNSLQHSSSGQNSLPQNYLPQNSLLHNFSAQNSLQSSSGGQNSLPPIFIAKNSLTSSFIERNNLQSSFNGQNSLQPSFFSDQNSGFSVQNSFQTSFFSDQNSGFTGQNSLQPNFFSGQNSSFVGQNSLQPSFTSGQNSGFSGQNSPGPNISDQDTISPDFIEHNLLGPKFVEQNIIPSETLSLDKMDLLMDNLVEPSLLDEENHLFNSQSKNIVFKSGSSYQTL